MGKRKISEEMTAGAGAIAGIGTGKDPEPGLKSSTIIARTKNLKVVKSKGNYSLDFNKGKQ